MIESKDISKMVKKILKSKKSVKDTDLMHPNRDWFLGLATFAVAVTLGGIFCYTQYVGYQSKKLEIITVTERPVPYQAATVGDAIKLYEAKQNIVSDITDNIPTQDTEVTNDVSSSTTGEVVNEVEEIQVDETEVQLAI